MPIAKVKLFSDDAASDLAAAIAAFQAGAGTPAISDQRGSAMAAYNDQTNGKTRVVAAVAYAGLDMPVSKTADQQFLCVEDDDLAQVQTKLDAALANALHKTVADGDTTVAGTLTSASMAFVAGDVGRLLQIGTAKKAILTYVSATEVTYDNAGGNFTSGTGQTVKLLGAESVQSVAISAFAAADGDTHFVAMLAVEGQIA